MFKMFKTLKSQMSNLKTQIQILNLKSILFFPFSVSCFDLSAKRKTQSAKLQRKA